MGPVKPMMVADTDNQYYLTRRGKLSAYGRARASSQTLRNILILLGCLLVALLCLLMWYLYRVSGLDGVSAANGVSGVNSVSGANSVISFAIAGFALSMGILGSLALVWRYTKNAFIEPDLAFRMWLQQVCDGDLEARIDLPAEHQHYNELNFHTRNLAGSLSKLSTDMENLVDVQTNRLEQQKAELKLLFDLTTVVSRESELAIVAQTICPALANWFDDVRVSLYKVGSEDSVSDDAGSGNLSPVDLSSGDLSSGELRTNELRTNKHRTNKHRTNKHRTNKHRTNKHRTNKLSSGDFMFLGSARSNINVAENDSTNFAFLQGLDIRTVPLTGKDINFREVSVTMGADTSNDNRTGGYATVNFFDGEHIAGVLVVEADNIDELRQNKSQRILSTVAQQLTLFVSKYSAVERGHKTRLYQQRSELAAEIHDSIAQTLLATRYQVTLLRESVHVEKPDQLLHSIEKIEGSIGEANAELRGLIHEYRSQLSTHRSTDSLQNLIAQFREQSGIAVFFQSKDVLIQFTPREDSVIQGIVSEVLINAQKYSQANTIRVLMRLLPSGSRVLLIEDDGVGFDYKEIKLRSDTEKLDQGNHIGLCIMHERALSIGAVLDIDSELGEGTRVTVTLPPLTEKLES